MTKSKAIILCADDFGLNAGVSQGILTLVQLRRLTAVSCMVNTPDFRESAPELRALKKQVLCGLHFNVTEGFFLTKPEKRCFTLKELLIKSHLGLVSSSFIVRELHAQLDRYTELMGELPQFIDGHQHVHQFPTIRSALIAVYEQRLKKQRTMIRSTFPAVILSQFKGKAAVLAAAGGKKLAGLLAQFNIPHNRAFAGVYDFSPATEYRTLFCQWLHLAPHQTLIMCHPGLSDPTPDPIAATRQIEMNYFLSDEFLIDILTHKVQLNRL